MVELRWCRAQLDLLPSESKEKMTQELFRAMRRGNLPSKREWKYAVQKAVRFYVN